MVTEELGPGGIWGRSKVWVLTIGVLEVNPELYSIRAQQRRARSAIFSRVVLIFRCREDLHDDW